MEDEKTGAELKRERELQGIPLRVVARVLNKSPEYISQLEQGKQSWPPDLERQYRELLEQSKEDLP